MYPPACWDPNWVSFPSQRNLLEKYFSGSPKHARSFDALEKAAERSNSGHP